MKDLAHQVWGLNPEMRFLNHGSFGAVPRQVQRAQAQIRARMESQPIRYFVHEVPAALKDAAAQVAELVGSAPEDLSFVDNASTGVNVVLRSLQLEEGDRLVTLSHVYPAVRNAMAAVAQSAGATVHEVTLPCPVTDQAWLQELDEALKGARFAVLDHVTSATGLVLPIAEMIALAHRHGVPVLVDGAHAPGLLPLNIGALGADYYTGNLHKWVCAPKGSAFLWAAPQWQASLRPPIVGHAHGGAWQDLFHTLGTRDYSNWLSLPAVLAFWAENGGLQAARERNNALASKARTLLLSSLGCPSAGPPEMQAAMVAFLLPNRLAPADASGAWALKDRLWDAHGIEIPITPHAGGLWMRLSAQLYNEMDDYRALLSALRAIQGE